MDAFTKAYIECALWSSNDESDDRGGRPLDENYSVSDIAPSSLARMEADCLRFQAENLDDILLFSHPIWTPDEKGGHDFWLTRNGHGAGFWDGDWPEEAGERLTKAAKAFGECDIYVGDDGLLYVSPE